MAKRVYGGDMSPVDSDKDLNKNVSDDKNDVVSSDTNISKSGNHFVRTLVIILVILLLIGFGGMFFYKNIYDMNNGASTPESAAIGFVQSISNDDSNQMLKYVPRKLRSDGIGSYSDDILDLRDLNEKYGLDISHVQVMSEVESLADNIQALDKGFMNVYGKTVNIKDAKQISVQALISYSIKNSTYQRSLTFDFICIKVDMKWYVYTAADSLSSDEAVTEESSTENDKTTSNSEESSTEDVTNIDVGKVKTEKVDLNFYDGAKSDLQAGKLKINDKEYTMPAKYKDMTDLFELIDDSIDKKDRLVKPNYILKTLPVWFVNKDYQMTDLTVSIANNTDKNIDLSDGLVTTLYISPVDPYDCPYVYLPGNVTFGTSYDDVVKMYGEKTLVPYTGEDDANAKDIIKHSDSAKIYELKLNNVHNHVYLSFEDNKLVAIEYFYYDLGDFLANSSSE